MQLSFLALGTLVELQQSTTKPACENLLLSTSANLD